MVIMLVFVLIVLLEMLISSFRGTKTNIARLIGNIASVLVAGGITFIISRMFTKTVSGLTDADLTLNGALSQDVADKIDLIISAFGKGIALSVIFSLLYLIIKLISILITKLAVRDNAPKGFKPAGLIFGLAIGLICAGFVLMPFTGLQQIFRDKETAATVSDLVAEHGGKTAGTLTRIAVGSEAERIARFTGIGLVTNKCFNRLTTAKTDSGEECLAEFLPPYFEVLDEVIVLTDEDELLSKKILAGAEALDAFSVTKLFSEPEKVGILKDTISSNISQLKNLPDYTSISAVAGDLSCAGRIVEVLEACVPENDRANLLDSLDFETLSLSDGNIEKIADNLYSMDAAPFYINQIMNLILESDEEHVSRSSFESTKPAFVSMIKTFMKLKDLAKNNTLDLTTLDSSLNELRNSQLITDADYNSIIETVRDNYAGTEIPDEVFDKYLR